MKTFLRYESDTLEEAKPFASKREAVEAFEATARELIRFGQKIEASLHIAASIDELAEYPDFVLSLGPREGVRCEAA
ncbi:hypothetical protein BX589_10118 [Paraburkholderia fungorum]|jgi:hypothetical protein|uniref:hypothetical protein n=1 Tax=Paraburkholderia fungorum TaxID=134537 RepID=UPI000D082BD6|nr:hypothetical protein [Paraburkholderia fungorum]PRZ56368.1 hypothetical protein BX589_10118 [Paraburkholderia fungorum]